DVDEGVAQLLLEEEDPAGAGADEPEDHPHGGGLPRPVGPEKTVEVALLHFKVEAFDGLEAAEPLGQTLGPEDGDHGTESSRSSWGRDENLKAGGRLRGPGGGA